jgi:hypothetical protein
LPVVRSARLALGTAGEGRVAVQRAVLAARAAVVAVAHAGTCYLAHGQDAVDVYWLEEATILGLGAGEGDEGEKGGEEDEERRRE